MHLMTILAFAFLFWRADQPEAWVLIGRDEIWGTMLVALGQPMLILAAAAWLARRAGRMISNTEQSHFDAQYFYHRALTILRAITIIGFAGTVFLTDWPTWFAFGRIRPEWQIFGDFLTLLPYFVSILGMWVVTFPFESAVRSESFSGGDGGRKSESTKWRFRSYLDFQIRHHVLVVAAPMALILFAANLTRGYESKLQDWLGSVWAPDAVLGAVAVGVFIVAPVLLRRIWRTERLPEGPVRDRLELLCDRIGLRCREILVWKSDGMMINAAVMGVLAPFRYVLLSDALLSTMNPRQVEAVFGHEAGHVRKHHMQHFLLFALVGWFAVSGLMEWMALNVSDERAWWGNPAVAIQGIGILSTIVIWAVGFGWLSRRFEQQADLFGARSVTPNQSECQIPCSVHLHADRVLNVADRVCATGAMVFASALDRVALLNGIPRDEKGWRHPSIAGRIRFLASVAGDPACAEAFEKRMAHLKRTMIVLAVVGAIATGAYLAMVPEPAVMRLQIGAM